MTTGQPTLPWVLISEYDAQLGGQPLLVTNERTIQFARWAYGWTLGDTVNTDVPVWVGMDGTEALDPQPLFYLPLVLPDGTPFPKPHADNAVSTASKEPG